MRRTTCSACGYDDLRTFLDLGSSPIADAYTSSPDELSDVYPLQLAVCAGCWLVQLLEVVDQETLFGTGYSFYSSASAPLSNYHATYAASVLGGYGDLAQRLTVEVGCNDGDMLRHFQRAGCPVVGVDPASGPVGAARERGLDVLDVAFTPTVAGELLEARGPAGLIIANHVLAHVEDVSHVLSGVSTLLAADGVAFVEVQYLPDLLVNNAFDLVYHEHRNFFSLTSLECAARRWGLYVADWELTQRQGGSLRVTLSKQRQRTSSSHTITREREEWLRHTSAYDGLQGRVERVRTRLRDLLFDETMNGRSVAGYGAPAKATTLLNFCGIDHHTIEFITDTTPAKCERYVPGTGIPIMAPSDALRHDVDTFIILAWNYAAQIIRNNVKFMDDGGRWIIPIPAPVLL